MELTTAWIKVAEERISELEDKIMEKEEAEKKRDRDAWVAQSAGQPTSLRS